MPPNERAAVSLTVTDEYSWTTRWSSLDAEERAVMSAAFAVLALAAAALAILSVG
jgi:hypothetical protein